MCDEQWYIKSHSKCESWLNKVTFFGYIVIKERIFMDLKTLRLMLHERDPQTLWRLKICLFYRVINDELWKDNL